MLLFAIRLHEDAISECMSKICDGGQDWEVEFWKSEKILNECRIEFNESSLPAEVISCLFACYYYKFIMTKMKSPSRATFFYSLPSLKFPILPYLPRSRNCICYHMSVVKHRR